MKSWPANGERGEFSGLITPQAYAEGRIVASQRIVGFIIGVTFADQRALQFGEKSKEGHLSKRIFPWRSHITQMRGKMP